MYDETEFTAPAMPTRFLSHGTLGCHDLQKSRRLYEVFLGIETMQTSPISLMIRLGTEHVYAVVQVKNKDKMPRYYHNGLDVETVEDVDSAHETAVAQAEIWGLTDISRPVEQHGT
ncbi:MAG: VOC family protein [Rhodospirillaceae bacterium]|nr:MAG: VOC family protein [Rhodospirillaceae bacterium]